MSRPVNNVLKAIRKAIPLKAKILLAVSGGKDSVALLHGCLLLKDKLKLRIGVAHVDHGLRKESKHDAEFVRKLALKSGLEYFHKKLKKPGKKENTEAWGRKERYKFFDKVLKANGYQLLLTAHTANDVAETLLMRLVSNKELNSIIESDPDRKLIRPLLSVSTSEIYSFIKSNGLKFVSDESNENTDFLRNRVRNKLIPFLEKNFDRRITETLSERARGLQDDIEGMGSLIADGVSYLSDFKFGSKLWLKEVKTICGSLPEFLSWRFVEGLVKPVLGFNLGRSKSKELLKFLNGEIQGIQLPGGKSIRLKSGGISIN